LATSLQNSEPMQDAGRVLRRQSGLLGEPCSDLQATVDSLACQLQCERSARRQVEGEKQQLGQRLSEFRQRDARLAVVGEMTAEFAHQVRTPLASAMLYAGQLDTSSSRQARIAGKILAGLGDLKRMVNDMLGFATGPRADHEQVNVQQLLNEVCDGIDGQLSSSTTLRVSVVDTDLTVAINRNAIKGALLNLVTNADQAGSQGTNILIHGHRFGEKVHLCVTDDGPGIPAEVQPRLFEAFFTTRPQGTGLGLAVVKAVVAAHDGDVSVNTSALGSSFAIQIPIAASVGLQR